jgi:hypothetical protein
MNRRAFLGAAATGLTGVGGGFLVGRRTAGSDEDDQPPRRDRSPAPDATGAHTAEKQAVTVGDVQAVSAPFVRVVDEIGVLAATERTPTDPGPEAFETLTAAEDHRFVVLYAEARYTDDRTGGPPASEWALDAWVPSQHLAPRVVDAPDTVWYRLPDGAEPSVGGRRLPAYARNFYHGGYLVFEVESPSGTIELLFRPDYDEFELDVPKATARWEFDIADDDA